MELQRLILKNLKASGKSSTKRISKSFFLYRFIPKGIKGIIMSLIYDQNNRNILIQYKSVFEVSLPPELLFNHRKAYLIMEYGIMKYSESESWRLAKNHMRIQTYNKLMTDDIIFSLLKK